MCGGVKIPSFPFECFTVYSNLLVGQEVLDPTVSLALVIGCSTVMETGNVSSILVL